MNTVKLYKNDPYLKSTSAKITEVLSSEKGTVLVLDRTVFFPTGGGQSCDIGKINEFEVNDVYEKDGVVYHVLNRTSSNVMLKTDDEVLCEIDWDHRFLNMQRHCGEHILSGIFFAMYGGVNRGFHMGKDYMTIDISLEENPEYTVLTWDMARAAEAAANAVIWSNAPVITRYYDSLEEAAGLPLRKKLTIEKDISIVCVGDMENPSDCVACCGTHPKTAGQVGLVKLLKVEHYKGMFRVYCDAGRNAMNLFSTYHEIITDLNNKYSASTYDLQSKMSALEEKNKISRNELYALKQSVMKERSALLMDELSAFAATPKKERKTLFVKKYSDMTTDDLINLGRPLSKDLKTLLCLVCQRENTVLLLSGGTPDCGRLVKENASLYQGKGGGNNVLARAIFPKSDHIDTFIDLLEKHLR